MTGVGETLLPLALPVMPCVMVNPRVPVATKDVFAALGLRNGELLVGASDVLQAADWPEAGASLEDWVEALAAGTNDLEAPAMRIQPVIGEVHRGAQRHQWRLAGADVGIGRDLLCDLRKHRRGAACGAEDPARSPRLVGACGNAELSDILQGGQANVLTDRPRISLDGEHGATALAHPHASLVRPRQTERHHLLERGLHRRKPETAPARRPPSRRSAGRG